MSDETPDYETKHLTLLTLAEGWLEMTPAERAEPQLWTNPLICSRVLYDESVTRYATDEQAAVLAAWVKDGLLVLSDDPGATRNRLREPVKQVNREARRKGA